MALIAVNDKTPEVHPDAWIAPSAELIGDVRIASGASVWFNTVLRADYQSIIIGEGSNVQDGSVFHITRPRDGHEGLPVVVGKGVTVGHQVILHACRVEDDCLIGMGATVLDGAVIGRESIVGAGALVTKGKQFPPRSLILGSPAKRVRELTDEEVAGIRRSAANYTVYCEDYGKQGVGK